MTDRQPYIQNSFQEVGTLNQIAQDHHHNHQNTTYFQVFPSTTPVQEPAHMSYRDWKMKVIDTIDTCKKCVQSLNKESTAQKILEIKKTEPKLLSSTRAARFNLNNCPAAKKQMELEERIQRLRKALQDSTESSYEQIDRVLKMTGDLD